LNDIILANTKSLFTFIKSNDSMRVQFEYVNPMVGLAMFIVGLFLIVFGYFEYGITPVVVGLVLIAYYRKYLWQVMTMSL
jgi:hypothetical protein